MKTNDRTKNEWILRSIIITLVLIFFPVPVFPQNVGINPTGSTPNVSAGLDVDFPDKGILIPRVALTATSNASPLAAHVAGMMVYNTSTAGDVVPGFYYNDGTRWITGLPSGTATGNMLYWNGLAWVMIPAGTAGQYLQMNASGIPAWSGGSFAAITTGAVSAITGTTASSGGNITTDGGTAILARGVCWNTAPAPTIANTKTSDGTGLGIFASNVTGLTPSTTYYLRAYAMNSYMISYGNEFSFTTTGVLPTMAATTAASAVTSTSANTGGNVTADGGSAIIERGVCYGTTANPTIANSKLVDPAPGIGAFTSNLTGLTGATLYYVRAYATNSIGTAYGTQISFTTLAVPPTLVTVAATGITGSAAVSGGSMSWNGGGYSNYQDYGVAYSTVSNAPTPTYVATSTTNYPVNITVPVGPWVTNIGGLSANTTYYIRSYLRLYRTSPAGWITVFGNELSFTTTAPTAPVIASTTAATSITINTAVTGGSITSDGGAAVTARGVCWATTPAPTTAGSFTPMGTGTGTFSGTLTGLSSSTTYYIRSYATNIAGTSYGPELSFTTCGLPFYTIGQMVAGGVVIYVDCSGQSGLIASTVDLATNLAWGCSGTVTGATGTALYSGLANTNAILAVCGTAGIPARLCADYAAGGINIPNFTNWYLPSTSELQVMKASGQVTAPSNLYSYWSSTESNATVASGWFWYGNYMTAIMKTSANQNAVRAVRKWTAPVSTLATLTTSPVTSVLSTTATSGGNITSDGGAPVTASGVCWSTTTGPTIANPRTNEAVSGGTFVSFMTGLTPSTTYYVRAYATNFSGTAYGNEVTFTTAAPALATLTTDPISSPTSTSGVSGGNVSSDGGAAVTARGVCWSTLPNPTTASNITTNGSGTGLFVSNITGLTPGTNYYIRAYATNSVGTAYGNEVTFIPPLAGFPVVTTDPMLNLVGSIAEGGGTVVSDGGSPILQAGICWNTSPDPTITTNLGITIDAAGIGTFFSSLSGLTLGTTYYVRAYATNINGTSYGSGLTFTGTAAYVGQVITGGWMYGNVFSIDATGLHGLIADPWGYGVSDWGCTGTAAGATGTVIGTGMANTDAILADIILNACASPSPNAAFAAEISKWNGLEWYLPSKDELDLLWTNRVAAGLDLDLTPSVPLWSSTEVNTLTTTPVWYFDGTAWQNMGAKNAMFNVWPIRSF